MGKNKLTKFKIFHSFYREKDWLETMAEQGWLSCFFAMYLAIWLDKVWQGLFDSIMRMRVNRYKK